jgi:hypothetical protein
VKHASVANIGPTHNCLGGGIVVQLGDTELVVRSTLGENNKFVSLTPFLCYISKPVRNYEFYWPTLPTPVRCKSSSAQSSTNSASVIE